MTRANPGSSSLYVYALLISAPQALRILDSPMEVLRFGDIAAAVERRRTRPVISERMLRKQHRIVQRLHETTDAILPVRFGALVDDDELARVIQLRRDVLRRALRKVRGKVQMSVRVFGRASHEPTVTQLTGSGADYLRARAAAARVVSSPVAKEVRRAVRSLVSDERLEPGRGALQVSIHHLVSRTRVHAYERRVQRVMTSAADVVLSGPWPPFAFTPDLWE